MVVGLVGCGRWGVHILRDLRALGCNVPVATRSVESVARAREGGASVVVADVSELTDVDGIVIATPTSTHAEVVEAALGHGVPVFVEKPLCADAAQAVRLSELGQDRLFVMDKWRYHPGVLELAAIARSGSLARCSGSRRGGSAGGTTTTTSTARGSWRLTTSTIALEILGRVSAAGARGWPGVGE